jgi:isoleucyl-tRNA synthetase
VVLDTRLDDRLRELGFVRELLNRIQTARKDKGLDFVDRIMVGIGGTERAKRLAKEHAETIKGECLAVDVSDVVNVEDRVEVDIEGDKVMLSITRAHKV